MGKKEKLRKEYSEKYRTGFDLDYWMSELVNITDAAYYPKPLKCMEPAKKKKM